MKFIIFSIFISLSFAKNSDVNDFAIKNIKSESKLSKSIKYFNVAKQGMLSEENMSKIGYYCVGVGGVLLGIANAQRTNTASSGQQNSAAQSGMLGGYLIAIGQYFKYKAHKKLD